MKLKRFSLIALISGLFISVLGFLIPLIYWSSYTAHNGTIGIIGGADAPTYTFMLSALFDGLPIDLVIWGITLVVSSVFCVLLSKTVKTYCNIKTSAISLALSGIGALGLVCAFLWFTIVAFGEMSKHPIEYPVSILLGVLCFFAFLVFVALYFKERKKNWSIKGVIIDFLTSIVYLPAFFFAFAYLYQIIT